MSISSARSRVVPPAAANIARISSRASGIVGGASFFGGLSLAAGDSAIQPASTVKSKKRFSSARRSWCVAGLIFHDERHARSAAGSISQTSLMPRSSANSRSWQSTTL